MKVTLFLQICHFYMEKFKSEKAELWGPFLLVLLKKVLLVKVVLFVQFRHVLRVKLA